MNDSTRDERDPIAALFEAARDGDEQARDALVDRLYPRVEKIVHKRLRSFSGRDNRRALALVSTGDVTHEVFLGMMNSAFRVAEQGEDAVVRYLATSVQNRLLDMLRYQRALRRDVGRRAGTSEGAPEIVAESEGQPWKAAAMREKLEQYQTILAGLPPKYGDVIRRRLEQAQSFAGIADDLGLPTPDAARKLFHYAHAKLLARLRAAGVRSDFTAGDDV